MLSHKLDLDLLRVAPSGEAQRVLVVDDEPLVRRWVQRVLVEVGYQVDVANDGLAAVAEIQRNDYALVLTDVTMPRMDGIGVLVAALARNERTPVVLMTGAPRSELLERALVIGAAHLLIKPMPMHEILETVGRFVRLRRLHELADQARALMTPITSSGSDGTQAQHDTRDVPPDVSACLSRMTVTYQPVMTARGQRQIGVRASLGCSHESFSELRVLVAAACALGRGRELGTWMRDRSKHDRARDDGLLFLCHTLDDLDELAHTDDCFGPKAARVVLELDQAPTTYAQRLLLEHLKRRGYRFCWCVSELCVLGSRGAVPDAIKLDVSFVRHVDQSSERQALCRALVLACRELGIAVIALGVQTPDEARALDEVGCELVQGGCFGEPSL